MRADIADWMALNMVRGIGPRTANQILDHFKTPAHVFAASAKDLELRGLKPDSIHELHHTGVRDRAREEFDRLESLAVEVIARDDDHYPRLLREICDPPIVLYIKGRFAQAIDRPCIAIVGSRRGSTYGMNTAERLARDLASRGLTIVSGLARGIDAAAHRGALAADGLTAAVIGTGIDATYPREHGHLADEIASSGAIVSEFPLGTPPLAQNFPYRNRVLSGLSLGALVIEAAEHSGSLITARLANEQGREVFAVPGQITSPNAFGPNCLIRDGAKLVTGWQDVVEELPRALKEVILLGEGEKASARGPIQPLLEPVTLSDEEQRVFRLLKSDAAIHIDELIELSGLPAPELMNALLGLEMKDRIRELRGKSFVKKL
jgi:DNA processing protein